MNEQLEFQLWIIARAIYWHNSGKTSRSSYEQCLKNARAKS